MTHSHEPEATDTSAAKITKLLLTWTEDTNRKRDFFTALRTCPMRTDLAILENSQVVMFLAKAADLGVRNAAIDFILDTVLGFWQAQFLRDPARESRRYEFIQAVEAMKRSRGLQEA